MTVRSRRLRTLVFILSFLFCLFPSTTLVCHPFSTDDVLEGVCSSKVGDDLIRDSMGSQLDQALGNG